MYDSYGDGWNGASVNVLVNGSVFIYGATISGFASSASVNFSANSGNSISLGGWVSGSWNSEISWDIKDGNGNVINSGMYGDGTTNVPAYCAPCKVPVHDEDFQTLPFTGWNSIQTNTTN